MSSGAACLNQNLVSVNLYSQIVIPAIHIIGAVIIVGWATLTLIPTPTRLFWKPAVAATEWGHWLALFSISFFVLDFVLELGLTTMALHLLAATLFLSPIIRAIPIARTLPKRLDDAFGKVQTNLQLQSSWGSPIVFKKLPHITLASVDQCRKKYIEVSGVVLGMDLYRPNDSSRCPATVIVVHGGSWNSGDSSQLIGLNRYLANKGYAVAAINYRLAPEYKFPDPCEDIKASIEHLNDHAGDYNLEKGKIVIIGRSSGGHLALLTGYMQMQSVCGVVALYAPTDLYWSWYRPAPRRLLDSNTLIRQFLGGTVGEVPLNLKSASPINFVDRLTPPTLLLHGGRDELVSPLQSHRLAKVLKKNGVPHLYLNLPWARHGMDANLAGPSGQITTYAIEHFISAVTRQDGEI